MDANAVFTAADAGVELTALFFAENARVKRQKVLLSGFLRKSNCKFNASEKTVGINRYLRIYRMTAGTLAEFRKFV